MIYFVYLKLYNFNLCLRFKIDCDFYYLKYTLSFFILPIINKNESCKLGFFL